MKRAWIWLAAAAASATSAGADEKPTQFWNLTSQTVIALRLSHEGSGEYGPNIADADADGVDHDERLKITDLPTGRYDVQLKFKGGRTCFARRMAVVTGKVFSVEDRDLKDCAKS